MEHELHPLARSSKRWAMLILPAAIAAAATIGAYTQATAASPGRPPPVVEPHCFGSADAAAYWLSSGPRPDCASSTAASPSPPPPVVEPHCFGSADAAAYWLSSAPRPDCASSSEREAPIRSQPGIAPSIRSIEGSVEDILPRPGSESER